MKKIVTVLSVRQPWAFLIIAGLKPIENRTWKTDYRGELHLHAGKSFDWDALIWLMNQGKMGELWACIRHFGIELNDVPEKSKITKHLDEFGAIIGRVALTDCVPRDVPCASEKGVLSDWAEVGCDHWKVADPVPITPIPLRGQLGLFKAEIEVKSNIIAPIEKDQQNPPRDWLKVGNVVWWKASKQYHTITRIEGDMIFFTPGPDYPCPGDDEFTNKPEELFESEIEVPNV